MEDHGRDTGLMQPRRHQVVTHRDRETQVKLVHRQLDPTQIKGLPLTESERVALLARVSALQIEIENAPAYEGVLA